MKLILTSKQIFYQKILIKKSIKKPLNYKRLISKVFFRVNLKFWKIIYLYERHNWIDKSDNLFWIKETINSEEVFKKKNLKEKKFATLMTFLT